MYGLGMWLRGRHPVHGLPFDAEVANELPDEYREQRAHDRRHQQGKVVRREIYLFVTGEAFACRRHAPAGVRRVLWIYQWTTIGDAIMDLAARYSLPSGIAVDLCITPALAPLFEGDDRFGAVYTRLADCPADYDFVLLHELSTKSIREKRSRFRGVPFAPMIGYLFGERFARVPFADARLRHVFRLPEAPPPRPTVALGPPRRPEKGRLEVAVALGARDPRRAYPHWGDVLHRIVDAWPDGRPSPRFHLLGTAGAAADLADIGESFVAAHAVDEIGRLDLRATACRIRDCHAFLGADGGLMHIAEAVGLCGLALFTVIDPAMRLGPDSRLQALAARGPLQELAPEAIATAFLAAVEADARRLAGDASMPSPAFSPTD